jgi:hypothetical protein
MNATYAPVLFAHSWLRWIVLALLALVVARAISGRAAGAWSATDERLHALAVGALDLQFTLGLWLYFAASPATRAFLAAPGPAMHDAVLRFYGLEHLAIMILGLAVIHVGRARSKRRAGGSERRRTVFAWTLAGLLLILAGVPWPFQKAGRPLLRTAVASVADHSERSTTSGSTLVARRAGM